MKIFLANPPWLDKDDPTRYGVRAGSRWPHFQTKKRDELRSRYIPFPHFLAQTAALLEKEGEEVFLLDGVAEGISMEAYFDKVLTVNPDLFLLETSTPSITYDLKFIWDLKEKLPHTKVALSGPHAPMQDKGFLINQKCIDFVLYGEYEVTLRELVLTLKSESDLSKVKGLIFRNKTGEVEKNEPRPLIANLDTLPFYADHFLPMKNYWDNPCGLPAPSVQMWTSRGCPFQCIFCVWPQIMYHGHSYRVRSVDKILDELEYLVRKYSFKSFYFDDDVVNIHKPRMRELCQKIIQRKMNLPWAIMARADRMDKDLLRSFKEAGLYSIKYGVESADQGLINGSGKKLNLKKAKEMVEETKKLGIKVHLTFAFGLPGETKETIKKTIDFVIDLDPHAVQFSLVTPFPGSRYYEMAKEKGWLLTDDWSRYNGSTSSVIRTEQLSAKDLEVWLQDAYQQWREFRS